MRKRLCLSMFFAALLCGCGGMLTSDQPPEHVYWLEAASLQLDRPLAEDTPDLVVVVDTLPGLDTNRILVMEPGARLNYYAGARWPDNLPELLTATVRLSLESSGRFGRVRSGTRLAESEWLLELEVREFFAVVVAANSPPEIHVQLVGHLNCGAVDTPVSTTTSALARSNNLTGIVAAFQMSTNDALINLGRQLETACFLKRVNSDNQ